MAYNAAHYLPELCRSIQAQTYPNFEVLILDDGSTDQTRSVLSAFKKDSRFKVFGWAQNRGVAAAFREVISRGRGEYWVCTGADDLMFPEFLERRLALLRAHPEAVIVHGATRIIDASGKALSSHQTNSSWKTRPSRRSGGKANLAFLRGSEGRNRVFR